MPNYDEMRLAVLIDADNVPYRNIKGILEEIAIHGTPTIKRIYADWTQPTVSGWKTVLLENAIQPIQQYSYSAGKNSTDSAMIIDAMDILYAQKVEGFCILSSDSDFTRLATRLREAGMKVFGFGERKTPSPFIVACNKFTYIDIIGIPKDATAMDANNNNSQNQINDDIVALIASSIDDVADETGWAFLGEVGNMILKKKNDFDSRDYGYPRLKPLIASFKVFEIDGQKIKHIKTRNKKKKSPEFDPEIKGRTNKMDNI
ncbi:MAG: NYN domain-containing protein [Paenibacillaceae bacterium]